MIRAVCFDIGGVLCPSPLDEFDQVDREYELPAGTIGSFVRGGEVWTGVETGQIPIAQFYEHCAETIADRHRVTVPVARLERMLEACMGTSMQQEMVDLVHEVKAAGYRTALLTNIFAERRTWLHGLFPDGVIDVICDSSEVGLRKPEPPIYEKLLQLLGLPAEEVVFIDDFEENVVAADALGLATIQFRDPAQTRAELARLCPGIAGAMVSGDARSA